MAILWDVDMRDTPAPGAVDWVNDTYIHSWYTQNSGGGPQSDVWWNTVDGSEFGLTVPARVTGKEFGFSALGTKNSGGDFPLNGDPQWGNSNQGSSRNETHHANHPANGSVVNKDTRWYNYSMYFDSSLWRGPSQGGFKLNFPWQLHDAGGGSNYSPIYAICISGWSDGSTDSDFTMFFYQEPDNTGAFNNLHTIDTMDNLTDQWLDVSWRIKYSFDNDGEWELYLNGSSIASQSGVQTFFAPTSNVGYTKSGGYGQPMLHFFDGLRIGDENSSITEILNFAGAEPPTPPPVVYTHPRIYTPPTAFVAPGTAAVAPPVTTQDHPRIYTLPTAFAPLSAAATQEVEEAGNVTEISLEPERYLVTLAEITELVSLADPAAYGADTYNSGASYGE